MLLCHCLFLLVAMVTKMQKITKKKKKKKIENHLRRNHWADWAQILFVAFLGLGNESLCFFMKIGLSVWLLWQFKVSIDL